MIIFHRSWCPHCQVLRERFAASSSIFEASLDFVMVNLHDEDDATMPDDKRFAPDGIYVPRVLFLDSEGNLMDVKNEAKYDQKYNYPMESELLKAMYEARRRAYAADDEVCNPLADL
ncbi:unnamed protein product [Darwinula stevensoni]|uniref:Thioredoxin domain-containing protein n=1 Tax=Darwinula stevensoni TaxID=69355 RepID=A0A7R9AJI4_9CRUS|nr:unnamed protein product [Darwinula stevensoni]CAG0907765.1 unnamed protein product [Darwinula stevensoni]